jgi:hypothetical protein
MPERQLYTNVLNLTHYKSKGLKLMDYEDTDIVVGQQFEKYAEIYRPLLAQVEPFNEYVKLYDKLQSASASNNSSIVTLENTPFSTETSVKFVSLTLS